MRAQQHMILNNTLLLMCSLGPLGVHEAEPGGLEITTQRYQGYYSYFCVLLALVKIKETSLNWQFYQNRVL